MPIYEFYCPDNNTVYSFFARSLAYAGKTPRCPDGALFRMEREISKFAITGRAKERSETHQEGLDDPRLQAAMAQMEREMAGVDTENPDPKMLAHMLRRVSELTGEKIPGQMNEMMRRMEAGEDLEQLEAEYGEALEVTDAEDGEGEVSQEGSVKSFKAQLLRMRRTPVRDPALYDMSEYVDG